MKVGDEMVRKGWFGWLYQKLEIVDVCDNDYAMVCNRKTDELFIMKTVSIGKTPPFTALDAYCTCSQYENEPDGKNRHNLAWGW